VLGRSSEHADLGAAERTRDDSTPDARETASGRRGEDTQTSSEGRIPYLEATDPSFAEQAARSFSVEEVVPGVLRLIGPCPRCSDRIEVPVVARVYRGAKNLPTTVPVQCTCDVDAHPGRPEGRVGCGAYWNLTVSGDAR
jgi:hypothetical protein